MAITLVTAAAQLQLLVKDPPIYDADGSTVLEESTVLTPQEYMAFVAAHVEAGSRNAQWQFSNMGGGLFVCQHGVNLAVWNPSFTEQGSIDYTVYCAGGGGIYSAPSIFCTDEDGDPVEDSRDAITVTGGRIRWPRLAAELLTWIATHRAQEYSQSCVGGSISPETARNELMRQAQILQGPQAF